MLFEDGILLVGVERGECLAMLRLGGCFEALQVVFVFRFGSFASHQSENKVHDTGLRSGRPLVGGHNAIHGSC